MIVVLLLFVAASPPPAPSSVLMPTSQRTLHIKSRLVSGGTGCIQLIYKIPSSSHLPSIPFLSLSSSRYHFLPSAFPSPTGESKVRPEGITKRLVSSQTCNVHVMSWEGEMHAHTCVHVCTVSGNHTSAYARTSFSAERWTNHHVMSVAHPKKSHSISAHMVRWRWNAGQAQVALWQRFCVQSKHTSRTSVALRHCEVALIRQ